MVEWYAEDLTRKIINAAYRINDHLRSRPGYRESSYREALRFELQQRGLKVRCPALHPRLCHGQRIGHGHIDLLVEDRIVVLVKCVKKVNQRICPSSAGDPLRGSMSFPLYAERHSNRCTHWCGCLHKPCRRVR